MQSSGPAPAHSSNPGLSRPSPESIPLKTLSTLLDKKRSWKNYTLKSSILALELKIFQCFQAFGLIGYECSQLFCTYLTKKYLR